MAFPKDVLPTDVISEGIGYVTTGTAGTTTVITASTAGAIYITDLVLGNGGVTSTILVGYGTVVVSPTGSAILTAVYIAAFTSLPIRLAKPFKIPQGNGLLATIGGSTSAITANYYVAP